tara:strand:+ start:2060 stop:2233 length:174 start_codon:yes stop_codon:yes gene_type:complete
MGDTDIMPWGIHKGKEMQEVPATYLIALLEKKKVFGPVMDYVKENEETLRLEVKQGL